MDVKNQLITEDYAIYNSDNMYVMANMPDESIDLSVYFLGGVPSLIAAFSAGRPKLS